MTRTWRVVIEVALVLVVAGAIAVLITWPVASDIGGRVPGGGPSSDVTGYLWDLWNNHSNGLDLWGPTTQHALGVPFGRPGVGGANVTLLVFTGPGWLLTAFLSPAAALNILTLAGLALSGAAMYLLIRWLGLGRGPAAWAAMAFEIAPYMFLRAGAHPPLVHLEFAPLLLMTGIAWLQRPGWRRALLLALAVAFAWLTNPYYGTMALVCAGIALVIGLALMLRRGTGRATWARLGEAVGFLVAVVVLPLLVLFSANGQSSDLLRRGSDELEVYGARIWDYVIPPPGSQLVEGITGDSALNRVYSPGGERTAFIGWLVIALAIVGVALAVRHRRAITGRIRTAVWVAVPVLVVMAVLSLADPTRVLGVNVPMPSGLLHAVLPFLRVYARFSVMVLAAALVLGAVGLRMLTRGRTPLFHHVVIALAIVISAVEMPIGFGVGSAPPVLVDGRTAEQVPTWAWLRAHADGASAIEVPAFTNEDLDRLFMYGQTVHGHPLANGGMNERTTPADFDEAFGNPLFPASATAYATAGARYVVVEPWAARFLGIAPLDAAHPPTGYKLVRAFSDGSAVWRVTAPAAPAITFPARATWGLPVEVGGMRWRYATASATMRAYAPTAARVTITIPARGRVADTAYPVTVIGPSGDAHRFTVQGDSRLRFTTTLPAGASDIAVHAPGVRMADWQVAPA